MTAAGAAAFGVVDDRSAHLWRLDGGAGVIAAVSDFGARLVELHVPGRDGVPADVVLGFGDAAAYAASPAYFGATVGRYGNRITRGRFTLRGRPHQVDVNEGRNHLHGGRDGWDSRLWEAHPQGPGRITFTTRSADGEMGFPGACEVSSSYELDGARLRLTMTAVPDADTVINMVHHSYYNLAGHGSGDVLGQLLRLPADAYVPVDGELMPTGEVLRVAGPYDFRELRPIGAHLDRLPPVGGQVFPGGGGYDHNWCLRGLPGDPGQPGGLVPAAEAVDPASGRRLRLWSTEPGVQMYTGGYLDDTIVGKGGMRYCRYAGFTLETQKFPDSPNIAWFPPALVEAGATYRHEMLLDLAPAE